MVAVGARGSKGSLSSRSHVNRRSYDVGLDVSQKKRPVCVVNEVGELAITVSVDISNEGGRVPPAKEGGWYGSSRRSC